MHFVLMKKEFLIKVYYAMIINTNQDQSLNYSEKKLKYIVSKTY